MGDIADWYIDQGIPDNSYENELYAQARELSDADIVKKLDGLQDYECLLDSEFAEKVQSICDFYKNRGFITVKQRCCLNSAFVENDQN